MCTGRSYLKDAYQAIFENDFNKAIEAFKKAISYEPENASYYFKLSITYSRNGEVSEALVAAKKANELQPDFQIYRYHLQILQSKNLVLKAADEMKKNNLTSEVEELLIQAKNLDPLNIEAYLLLGIYHGENKSLNLALKEFNLVLNLQPLNQQAKVLKDYYIKNNEEGDKNE